MRDDITRMAHRIITEGLRLKERLDRSDRVDLEVEQGRLKALFGDLSVDASVHLSGRGPGRAGDGDRKLYEASYALACWLDEIIILDSPAGAAWDDRSLESTLFNSRIRAEKFWELAEQASSETIEVFYLCVMLGFRGKLRDQPDKVKAWRKTAEARIETGRSSAAPLPRGEKPPTDVPPLRGRDRLRQVIIAVAVVLGLLIPVASFFFVFHLGK